jgi:hypothetical protein
LRRRAGISGKDFTNHGQRHDARRHLPPPNYVLWRPQRKVQALLAVQLPVADMLDPAKRLGASWGPSSTIGHARSSEKARGELGPVIDHRDHGVEFAILEGCEGDDDGGKTASHLGIGEAVLTSVGPLYMVRRGRFWSTPNLLFGNATHSQVRSLLWPAM